MPRGQRPWALPRRGLFRAIARNPLPPPTHTHTHHSGPPPGRSRSASARLGGAPGGQAEGRGGTAPKRIVGSGLTRLESSRKMGPLLLRMRSK